MNHSTRSKRVRQRPKTKKIRRHQNQPLLWPDRVGPVFANRQIRVKVQPRGKITPYGGVSLAHDLAMRLELDRDINRSIRLLKTNVPYFESDHILTHVYNLYVGGRCIEDIANLQHSEDIKHLLGACRIPDPTTAGDFLRRFHKYHLQAFQAVIDRAREKVWRKLPRSRKRVATVDLGSLRRTLSDRVATPSPSSDTPRHPIVHKFRIVAPPVYQNRHSQPPRRGAATGVRPHDPQLALYRSRLRANRTANAQQQTRARLSWG